MSGYLPAGCGWVVLETQSHKGEEVGRGYHTHHWRWRQSLKSLLRCLRLVFIGVVSSEFIAGISPFLNKTRQTGLMAYLTFLYTSVVTELPVMAGVSMWFACICGIFLIMVPIWALPEDVKKERPLNRKWQRSSRISLLAMLWPWLHVDSSICFTVRRPGSLSWVYWWWRSPICT